MEFGLFILIIGVILLLITLTITMYGMFVPKDPNCPEQVNAVKTNKKSLVFMYPISAILIIIGLILYFCL